MLDWNRFVRDRLALKLRPERESDIINELAELMEHTYTEAMAGGATHEEALRRAEKEAGDWRKLSREITAAEAQPKLPEPPPARMSVFAGFRHDLVYALRFLRKKPVFALIAAGTLAFGIGANTAMFTLVDAIVLRGLPYPEPSRLVTLGAHREKQKDIAIYTSAPDFFDLRKLAKSFSELAGISPIWNMVTTGATEADRLEALFVSSNFFPMLGVSPLAGRVFTAAEDQAGHAANVVVLGHSYWQRAYGGSLDALNKTIALDSSVYTIIGVMPPDFRYLGEPVVGTMTEPDVWIPMAANPLAGTGRGLRYMKVLGHLAPGVTLDQARDELRRIGLGLAAQYPQTNSEKAWELRPLNDEAFGKYRTPVFLLLGAVGFVLLLASANVANLLLARVVERKQEMSIRTALGASAYRILRQLLAESLVLSALGGVLGGGLALAILQVLVKTGPASLMRAQKIGLDARALLFTSAIVILAATLSGLAPAWRTVTAEIGNALRASGRSLTAGTHRFRSGLVIVQVAVALVLLVGAGLLIRSFQNLLLVDPGFRAENLVTISTQLPASARTPEQMTALNRGLMEQLMTVPGVEQVAEVSRLPMMASDLTTDVMAEGKPLDTHGTEVQFRRTTPNYFQAMGIPVRGGRVYASHDTGPVVLLDEVAARMIWPGENAVGKRIKVGSDTKWTTVIGVVGQTRNFGLDIAPSPTLYVSDIVRPLGAPLLEIRTSRDPAPLLNTLAATIRRAHQGMPAYNVFLMQTLVDRSTAQRRFIMMLLTAFAMAAMLLAAVGVYGSISHTVAYRTREIGLRIALGATPAAALRMVLGEGLRLTGAGVAIGIVAAAGLTRA
ncbi:MAG TPA: ABC transporter permease, partial [Bryobacteraceae bacterium]|nr:ABC transporter permease [Bryobacteraceae bacterium]